MAATFSFVCPEKLLDAMRRQAEAEANSVGAVARRLIATGLQKRQEQDRRERDQRDLDNE